MYFSAACSCWNTEVVWCVCFAFFWWWQADTPLEYLCYSLGGGWIFLVWKEITDVSWQVLRFLSLKDSFMSDERSMSSPENVMHIWIFIIKTDTRVWSRLLSPDCFKFTVLWTIHWGKLFSLFLINYVEKLSSSFWD